MNRKLENIKKLYFIEPHNRHKQILIFTSRAKAKRWLQTATTHTAEQIEQEIKTADKIGKQEFYNLFPTVEA